MTFTASGPFLLLFIIYVFIRVPGRLVYLVFFFAPFSATAIINMTNLGYKSGGLGLTPAMLCTVLFIGTQIGLGFAFRPVRVSDALRIQIGLIGAFTVIFLFSLSLNSIYSRVSAFQMTQAAYVVIGLLTVVLLAVRLCRDNAIEVTIRVIRTSAIFVACWGVLQFGCWNLGIPYPNLLFNNSQSDAADMFDQVGPGFIRIASVAVEPSFFASSMLHFVAFGATLIAIEPRLRTRYWILPVVFTTAVLLLSTSSTAYFGLVVLGGLLLLRRPQISLAIGIPAVLAGIVVMLLVPKVASVLATMTVDKSDSTSYVERTQGALKALATFQSHPIFGAGWGAVEVFNSITASLADVGLIGSLSFALATGATLLELQPVRMMSGGDPLWRLSAYATGVQHSLIVAFAISVSSGIHYVVADDWCFWALGIAVASVRRTALTDLLVPGRSRDTFHMHTSNRAQVASTKHAEVIHEI